MSLAPTQGLGARCQLCNVLDSLWHRNPLMHAFLVHRHGWTGKARIGKGSDRDSYRVWGCIVGVVEACSAPWAEPEHNSCSFITDSHVLCAAAFYLDGASGEASERGKDTSRSALALEAVTYADHERLHIDLNTQLAARAGGGTHGWVTLASLAGWFAGLTRSFLGLG